jgi:TonB family protein
MIDNPKARPPQTASPQKSFSPFLASYRESAISDDSSRGACAMTPATPGSSSPNLFSMFSCDNDGFSRLRGESFAVSLLMQAVVIAALIYVTCCVFVAGPPRTPPLHLVDLPLIFSGSNGGGGGMFDKLPASHGNPPKFSLDPQLVPPNVMRPTEMPKLAVPETIEVAPDVQIPQGGQIGDPASPFSKWLSSGPGGPGGIGTGCCDGVGNSAGPHLGSGPPGIYPAGKMGVTVPQAIYSPEPAFSDEARKMKQQGIVQLLLVVGKDGHAYDIRVRQSLGMGLDEKAMEAVSHWRFRPATLNGQPVATQIAVEVDFHLY